MQHVNVYKPETAICSLSVKRSQRKILRFKTFQMFGNGISTLF